MNDEEKNIEPTNNDDNPDVADLKVKLEIQQMESRLKETINENKHNALEKFLTKNAFYLIISIVVTIMAGGGYVFIKEKVESTVNDVIEYKTKDVMNDVDKLRKLVKGKAEQAIVDISKAVEIAKNTPFNNITPQEKEIVEKAANPDYS